MSMPCEVAQALAQQFRSFFAQQQTIQVVERDVRARDKLVIRYRIAGLPEIHTITVSPNPLMCEQRR